MDRVVEEEEEVVVEMGDRVLVVSLFVRARVERVVLVAARLVDCLVIIF